MPSSVTAFCLILSLLCSGLQARNLLSIALLTRLQPTGEVQVLLDNHTLPSMEVDRYDQGVYRLGGSPEPRKTLSINLADIAKEKIPNLSKIFDYADDPDRYAISLIPLSKEQSVTLREYLLQQPSRLTLQPLDAYLNTKCTNKNRQQYPAQASLATIANEYPENLLQIKRFCQAPPAKTIITRKHDQIPQPPLPTNPQVIVLAGIAGLTLMTLYLIHEKRSHSGRIHAY